MPYKVSMDFPKVNDARLLKGKILFFAVFPKSGSTYLSNLLSKLTGYSKENTVQLYGHNEQDICEARLRSLVGMNAVIQQHTKGTLNNTTLLRKYHIKPVVLVRNIFDVIVSISDHLESEDSKIPMGYVHPEYWNMSSEDKRNFIIVNMLPWYLDFYVSWRDESKTTEVLWLTYEELFENQATAIRKILKFYGMESKYSKNEINQSIELMPTSGSRVEVARLNIGKSGRGETLLTHEQKLMVVDIAKAWKLSDGSLEAIGIQS
jgi:hypothetical protein